MILKLKLVSVPPSKADRESLQQPLSRVRRKRVRMVTCATLACVSMRAEVRDRHGYEFLLLVVLHCGGYRNDLNRKLGSSLGFEADMKCGS